MNTVKETHDNSNNKNKKEDDDKLKKKNNKNNDLANLDAITSNNNLWQQYSPMPWSDIYNEYVNYTKGMTEIYNGTLKVHRG
ncbi:MAG TPA: hypothetical protein VIP70_01745 [Nitrososphaeraceae archaeon]